MRGKAALARTGDDTLRALRHLTHHRADGIRDASMVRQDHLAAQPLAHGTVVGRGRGPKPDHRHAQPDRNVDHTTMPLQSGPHQGMPCQRFRRCVGKRRVFGKRRLQQTLDGLLGQLIDNRLRQTGRIPCDPLTRPIAPPRQQSDRQFCRRAIPDRKPPQHMTCIRRRDPGDHHQSARHQAAQRGHFQPRGQRFCQRHRPIYPRQHGDFARTQSVGRARHRQHKATVKLARGFGSQRAFQCVDHHRTMRHRQQGHRDQPAWPQSQAALQPLGDHMHFAVAAQTGGAHRHRLDHGTKAANPRAFGVNLGQAIAQQGDVGGGAADVGHQCIARTRQPARADNTGGRAGQDRLDRSFAHHCRRDQRAVATHHHQRCRDAHLRQMTFAGRDQPVDHPDQPRIQHRGQRPFRSVQLRRKLVRAGHRPPGHATDQRARRQFMRRVAGGKPRRHGEPHHLRPQFGDGCFQCDHIQCCDFGPGMAVSARHHLHRIALQRFGQPAALQIARVKADENQCDPAALALDQGVGGQSRRQRHQRDIASSNPSPGQSRIHRPPDTKRQIAARGQRFCAADHPVGSLVHNHRIGVCAPGIDTQKIRHSVPPTCSLARHNAPE